MDGALRESVSRRRLVNWSSIIVVIIAGPKVPIRWQQPLPPALRTSRDGGGPGGARGISEEFAAGTARWSPLILRAYAVTTTELAGRSVKKRVSVGGRALHPPSSGRAHGRPRAFRTRARVHGVPAARREGRPNFAAGGITDPTRVMKIVVKI